MKKILAILSFSFLFLLFGSQIAKADSTISNLNSLASPSPGDYIPVVHNGNDYKMQLSLINNLITAATSTATVKTGGIGPLAGPTGITRVLGFGDSITGDGGNTSITGYCSPNGNTEVTAGSWPSASGCYIDLVAQFYNANEYNNGDPGTCLGTYGSGYYCATTGGAGITRYTTDLVPYCSPGTLVVFQYAGANEIRYFDAGFQTASGIASFQSQMDTMLSACVTGYGTSIPTIAVVDTTPQTGLSNGISNMKFQYLNLLRQAVQNEAVKYGLPMVKANDLLSYCWPDALPLNGGISCSTDGVHPSNGTVGTSANLGNAMLATAVENATFANTIGLEGNGVLSAALLRPQILNSLTNYGCGIFEANFTSSSTTPANCPAGYGDIVTTRANGTSGRMDFGGNIFTNTTAAITVSASPSPQPVALTTGGGTNFIPTSTSIIDTGTNAEAVTVLSNGTSTYTASFTKSHNSGVQVEDETNSFLDFNISHAGAFNFGSPLFTQGNITIYNSGAIAGPATLYMDDIGTQQSALIAGATGTIQGYSINALAFEDFTGGHYFAGFDASGDMGILGSAKAIAFTSTSTLSSKFNVRPLESGYALSLVDKTQEYRFCYKGYDRLACPGDKTRRIGIIADYTDADLSTPQRNGFDLAAGAAVSLAAIRELHEEVKEDEKKIERLEKEKGTHGWLYSLVHPW